MSVNIEATEIWDSSSLYKLHHICFARFNDQYASEYLREYLRSKQMLVSTLCFRSILCQRGDRIT